jgi:putative ABC transport system permease protein
MALADVAPTGLVQPGSRVTYRLIVAGPAAAVRDFERQTRQSLGRGQRLESAADARPEVRRALDRAGQFLGIVAVLAVVLAAAAMAMAARQHSQRQMDAFAVMRCLGASKRELLQIQLGELALVGALGTGLGLVAAWALALVVGRWLAPMLGLDLPPPSLLAILPAAALGLGVLLAFAGPPLLALRRVPALRVLRRDVPWQEASALAWAAIAAVALGALLWWQAGSAEMGARLLGGIAATLLVLAGLAWALVRAVGLLRRRLRGPWRLGLANLTRRPAVAVAQTTALGLGLMALLLLVFVRGDLLERWRTALPADAPNRFLLNAQPDQIPALQGFLREQGLRDAVLWPMVRARYTALNGTPITRETYADEGRRARRLAEREFNLSTAEALDADNRVVAGAFWSATTPADGVEFSVEVGLAETLGWSVGDTVRFDVAGTRLEGRVTSLREVRWESFKPNFFVLVSPSAMPGLPASYISAIHLPAGRTGFTRSLLDAFPNLSVVDIDAILAEVTRIADQVSRVIEVVFLLAIAAGVLVLLAAVLASQDERLREGALMRVLGADRATLRWAQVGEFAAIGLVAGGVAAIAASLLSGVVANQLDLPSEPDWAMAAAAAVMGMGVTLASGLMATRRTLNVPPARVLRSL